MEERTPEKKEPIAEEMKPEQMEDVTGAGFLDRIGCFFSGHNMLRTIKEGWYGGDFYQKKQCTDCGTMLYFKNNESCSESTFNSVEGKIGMHGGSR